MQAECYLSIVIAAALAKKEKKEQPVLIFVTRAILSREPQVS